jgi:RNA polymerase sigma-70 factor (ECF subfamily)
MIDQFIEIADRYCMADHVETILTQPLQADIDEGALLECCKSDPRAIIALYHKYLPKVYHYLLSHTGDRLEAEDLTSQVFLAALEGLPGYRHQGYFAAWLFSIARRKAVDLHRRRRHRPLQRLDDNVGEGEDLLEQVILREESRNLANLVVSLKDKEKELLRLRFAAELSFDEIAVMLQRSPSAVKMSIYRLLRRLERQMEANEEYDR